MELVYIYPMDKSKDMQKMLDEEFWKRLGPTVRDCKAMGLDKDGMCIYIKVKDDVITDVSFLVFGCVAAIATSSMTTVLAKGNTMEEAYKLADEDITNALGGLPEHKLHCSVLGADALKQAVENYYYSREQQSI